MKSLTIYKSSAGSGKTFTLVLEYLKIVILHPNLFRNILAVTFTNKATSEMKDRIILALEELAASTDDELAQSGHGIYIKLREYLDARGKGEVCISSQANRVLEQILNSYANFSVSTIESFFQKVIRAFTRELNIPLGFDVEMQQDLVLERLVHKMFMDLGSRKNLTKLFRGMLDRKLDDEKGWNIEPEIKRLGSQIFREKYQKLTVEHRGEEGLVDQILEFTQELTQIRRSFEAKMKAWAKEALSVMEAYDLEREDFKYKATSVPGYFVKILNRNDFEPGTRARKATEDISEWFSQNAPKQDEIQSALHEGGLLSILVDMVAYYDDRSKDYYSADHMNRTIYSFGVLDDLRQMLADYRKENQQLIISDTNFLLRSITHDPHQALGANAPFIYEKVGTRYHFYLLDEFQDTSDLQWENLKPLVVEAISQQLDGLEDSLKVGLMGDVKQSIYRWRNGNMRLLLDKVETQVFQETGQRPVSEPLDSNWRTSAGVVAFNNTFFKAAASLLAEVFPHDRATFEAAYNEVSQYPKGPGVQGLVQLQFFENPKKKDKETLPSWKELALAQTVRQIRELLSEGFLGRDITLLVRKNHEGTRIAEHLQQHGIKVISAESLLLKNYPGINFILSLLKALVDDSNEILKAALGHHQTSQNFETERNYDFIQEPRQGNSAIDETLRELTHLPLFECVTRICTLFPIYREPNAYVQGFLDAVLEYSSRYDASISGFLEWWEEVKDKRAVATAEDNEAVRIMTIHKAKGLEFPVVILPFCDWSNTPSGAQDIMWIDGVDHPPYDRFPYLPLHPYSTLEKTYFFEAYEEERMLSYLDNLNLLYVAFTRPKYRLYIFSKTPQSKSRKLGDQLFKEVHELVYSLVSTGGLPGMWNAEEDVFEYGEQNPSIELTLLAKARKKIFSDVELKSTKGGHEDWEKRLKIRFGSNRYLKASVLESREKIMEGELLHDALAHIERIEDVEKAVTSLRLKGMISKEYSGTLMKNLEAIVSRDHVKHWFQGNYRVKNEADILGKDGEMLRPDRVMLKENEAIVIDYKSGEERSSYKKQVRLYMEALHEMKHKEVKGFIYYLGSGLVDEVFLAD